MLADGFEKPPVVPPVDPLEGREFEAVIVEGTRLEEPLCAAVEGTTWPEQPHHQASDAGDA
jgi:hypothetical protein